VEKKLDKEDELVIFNKQKDEQAFIVLVCKITPEEFIALCKILSVKMSVVDKESGEYTLRDAEEIVEDCVNTFRRLPHKARKEILKAMAKSKGVNDGPTTEDSTN
jgi:hypothetical protein